MYRKKEGSYIYEIRGSSVTGDIQNRDKEWQKGYQQSIHGYIDNEEIDKIEIQAKYKD